MHMYVMMINNIKTTPFDILKTIGAASDLDIIANVTYEHLKLKDSILILIQWKVHITMIVIV